MLYVLGGGVEGAEAVEHLFSDFSDFSGCVSVYACDCVCACARGFFFWEGEVSMREGRKVTLSFLEDKFLDSDGCHLYWVLLNVRGRRFSDREVFNVKMKLFKIPIQEKKWTYV